MKITTVLFDLDGTLLPMDNDYFTQVYFKLLAGKMADYGYKQDELISAIWTATKAMVLNDGTKTNEQAFWEAFTKIYGQKALDDYAIFDSFYRNEFQLGQKHCGFNPKAAQIVQYLKDKEVDVALATNPIFPKVATESRISWAGLNVDDFKLFTSYENSHYCKPNIMYYKEVCDKLKVDLSNCVMVGNDVGEDMVVADYGMKVFLLTDCLLNKKELDTASYPQGNFDDLKDYLDSIL
ncbi:MAG: HAD family hydrolase [Erysipelotrichaceae bacterium]